MTPVALGGYPAKQCPRATHNRFTNEVPRPQQDPPSPELQARFDQGKLFELGVMTMLEALGYPVLALDAEPDAAIQRTLDLVAQQAPLIGRAHLPTTNRRSGLPDLLVRTGDGYLPVDVKNHSLLEEKTARSKKPDATVSSLTNPVGFRHAGNYTSMSGSWLDDAFQLAHYTRMLQDLGLHPGDRQLLGGVISNDDFSHLVAESSGICWFDLTARVVTDYSPSTPSRRDEYSVMERYDEEFRFRLEVADSAAAGQELVQPLGTAECSDCQWLSYCSDKASEHPSFQIHGGPLKRREWLALESLGGGTLEGLATMSVSAAAALFEEHSVNTRSPGKRLAEVIRRAAMLASDPPREFEPLEGNWPTHIPAADIEVDLDLEWDMAGRIFQWGIRVREGHDETTARYLDYLVASQPLSDEVEQHLAARALSELQTLAERAARDGQTLAVFHWSHPEVSMTRKFPAVASFLEDHAHDLLTWWRNHFFTVHGNGIKRVATLFGYEWGVPDPGGLKAELRLAEAHALYPDPTSWNADLFAQVRRRGPVEDPLAWVLMYNESDVEAQAKIRDGLRRQLAGRGSVDRH